MAKKNELAVLDTFKLTKPFEGMDPELLEELEDELADLDEESGITCRRIKMPSGGALAFEVQGEDEDDVEYVKEIQGVILYTHRVNGYWSKPLGNGEGGAAPECSSMDGKTGVNLTTGECVSCDTCPLNQYGTDPKGGAGKAHGERRPQLLSAHRAAYLHQGREQKAAHLAHRGHTLHGYGSVYQADEGHQQEWRRFC